MHRSYHRWHSSALGRDMELLLFGHHGAPVLVFPTSMGRFFEFEDRGMTGLLAEHLERGWLQLICVDSVDAESWYCKWAHPSGRIGRQLQYEQYLIGEVVPWLRNFNQNQFLMSLGCSFGAFHAVNLALRHPHLFRRCLGLSGRYNMRSFMDGYSDDQVYFNTPTEYTANLHDVNQLAHLRQLDIILAIGRDDPSYHSNQVLSDNLWNHGVGNALRVWDGWAHDWPYWEQMLPKYIQGHD
ncbi:esterase family protein [Herpetosiphon giganteus]|uniref:esterase family protein n=1 Tax=Herpetosiphon giganteus TaxID=2029754 RepID=UPI00195A9BB6|nr:alpha/beta hydrolase-fold protein [Herpetosiphon giganteus]MBM7841718.1 esterase/lipase superfamily enzyme [Herpetosiphon giganteus]